jgi:hypothetical protein
MVTYRQQPLTLKALKGRLLLRTLVVNFVSVLVLSVTQTAGLVYYMAGATLGLLFLITLFFSVEHPRGKAQTVMSIGRMIGMAYIIVALGNFNIWQTFIVICGFLSYKLVLVLEYLVQASPAFKRRHLTGQSASASLPGSTSG